MKAIFIFLLCLYGSYCFGNMSSPIGRGTLVTSAFTSNNIDIIHEKLTVTPDKGFKTALYTVEYTIKTDTTGSQIPLLFYAMDYEKQFEVWVDGKPVVVQNIPSKYTFTENTPFKGFTNSFSKSTLNDTVHVSWTAGTDIGYPLSDLKYFETSLSKGQHTVKVEYTANAWVNRSTGWIKEYSFRYSLSPAQYWRSFGTLDVVLDAANLKQEVKTNLGEPQSGGLSTVAKWTFNKLPGDYFIVSYTPKQNLLVLSLLALGPFGIALIITICLIAAHVVFLIRFRKANPAVRYSWVVTLWSLIIPFLFFLIFLFSFDVIDDIIGSDASRYHGYVFLVLVFCPVVMLIYWLVMWLIDRSVKRMLARSTRHSY